MDKYDDDEYDKYGKYDDDECDKYGKYDECDKYDDETILTTTVISLFSLPRLHVLLVSRSPPCMNTFNIKFVHLNRSYIF